MQKNVNMKNVVIALDYNSSAQQMAQIGYDMAKSIGAEIYLVHVMADPTYYYTREYSPITGFSAFSELEATGAAVTAAELKKAAQEFLDKSKESLGDNAIHTVIKEDDVATGILEAARDVNAEFIVIGTHGRKGWDKILMGSVAEKVLHQSDVPLYIIPAKSLVKES